MKNIDLATVEGFGDEWTRFNQRKLEGHEYEELFQLYFGIFPWSDLPPNAVGFDLGCGSGRWARGVAPRIGKLHCIDPSREALQVARANLKSYENCEFHEASVDEIPLPDHSMDFGYSLGVLHHIPDTQAGIEACVRKLKPGAPFLVYLYYAFDQRPVWFRSLWKLSDWARRGISRSPHSIRYGLSQVLAAAVYFPLARSARVVERMGRDPGNIPLSFYRDKSFYTMRTDALDRFGTRLEQRFTRKQIQQMMEKAGLADVHFSERAPFWVAVGKKR